MGDIPQPRGTNAIHARLVFLDLLKLDADGIGQLLLRCTIHPPAMADPRANMDVYFMLNLIHGSSYSCMILIDPALTDYRPVCS
jgi:hypothetical protein